MTVDIRHETDDNITVTIWPLLSANIPYAMKTLRGHRIPERGPNCDWGYSIDDGEINLCGDPFKILQISQKLDVYTKRSVL